MKKLLTFMILGTTVLNAYGNDCPGQFDPRSGICRFQGHNGQLVQYHAAPPQSGTNTTTQKKIIRHVTVNIPSKYGALASDRKTAVISGSMNENSLAEAKKAALQRCSDGGKNKNCKIITWVRNGCFAAAAGKSGTIWKLYDVIGELGETERKAMSLCEAKSSECRITVSETCSIP